MSDLDERVLVFVEANPGATSRAVATHIFGSAKVRSSERTRICAVLRRLVDSGRLTATERPGSPTSLPCNLYAVDARRAAVSSLRAALGPLVERPSNREAMVDKVRDWLVDQVAGSVPASAVEVWIADDGSMVATMRIQIVEEP
jgi:imidazolonepropionase-like amidohydrolase